MKKERLQKPPTAENPQTQLKIAAAEPAPSPTVKAATDRPVTADDIDTLIAEFAKRGIAEMDARKYIAAAKPGQRQSLT